MSLPRALTGTCCQGREGKNTPYHHPCTTTDVNAGHERGPLNLYSGCLPAYDTPVKVDKRSFKNPADRE